MSKAMNKRIDRAFAEWYKTHNMDDPLDGDYSDELLNYVANAVGVSRQELDWFLE